MQAQATFEGKAWDEKPYSEIEGVNKLTRANIVNVYQGDIDGQGTLDYLLFYRDQTGGTFIGYERVTGRLCGRSGSFVMQHEGSFENGTISCTVSVVPGSGSGDLRGLQGKGSFVAHHTDKVAPITLDVDFQ